MPYQKNTIKDIARQAGVAPSTVSRVINNHQDVSPATYEKVKAVIDQFGFQPNIVARNLVQKRTSTLALVTSSIPDHPKLILSQVEAHARMQGYKLIINVVDTTQTPLSEGDIRTVTDLSDYHVDGIIWSAQDNLHTYQHWNKILQNLEIPVVCINSRASEGLPFVAVDNLQGGYLATKHLLEQGYRRIGVISGPASHLASIDRIQGWQKALHEAGIEPELYHIAEGDYSPASGASGFLQLMDSFSGMDGLFVCNDQMALGAMQTAAKLGVQIPQELGVVGFDDRAEAPFFTPPLTSINHHFEEMGSLVIGEIDRLIKMSPQEREHADTINDWITPELVMRASSQRFDLSVGIKGGAS